MLKSWNSILCCHQILDCMSDVSTISVSSRTSVSLWRSCILINVWPFPIRFQDQHLLADFLHRSFPTKDKFRVPFLLQSFVSVCIYILLSPVTSSFLVGFANQTMLFLSWFFLFRLWVFIAIFSFLNVDVVPWRMA